MSSWSKQDVQLATKIFFRLWEKGKIDKSEREYINGYHTKEVREILEDNFEKATNVRIFSIDETIYMTPGINNELFGYTNEELKHKLLSHKYSTDRLYLAYFVVLNLLAKFYNSAVQTGPTRQFLMIEELEETITNHLEPVYRGESERVVALSLENGINFKEIAETWMEIPKFDITVKYPRKGKHRIAFILKVLDFLVEEDLVQLLEDQEIRLLPKMEHLIMRFYFNTERREKLFDLVSVPFGITQREED